ncbi:MAG: hypothetical protein M3020_22630 [Myxococcota bacterium]|nr:hypothetical protein [Myxococcota bacterium]
MRARFARAGNEITSEVFFGCERVVGAAAQSDVFEAMLAAEGERFQVMQLEPRGLTTAFSRFSP